MLALHCCVPRLRQVPLSFVVRAAREALSTNDGAGPGPGSKAPQSAAAAPLLDGAAARRRLALCRARGLVPEHNVFKVHAGRAPPAALTEVLQVLLTTDEAEIKALRQHAQQQQQEEGQKPTAATAAAEAILGKGKGRQERLGGGDGARGASGTAGVQKTGKVEAPGAAKAVAPLAAAYRLLAERMLSRYTCSLAEDRLLLQRYAQLPPRLQAALLARMPEKEALEWLRDAIGSSTANGSAAAKQQQQHDALPVARPARGGSDSGAGNGVVGHGAAGKAGQSAGKRKAGASSSAGGGEAKRTGGTAAAAGGPSTAAPFAFSFAL